MKGKNQLRRLTYWDWTTLVASWRYYEHRHTIVSATFPHEVVDRYFSGWYDKESCDCIARQFVEIDHHDGPDHKLSGWVIDNVSYECDIRAWRLFYWFLKAWHEAGFCGLYIRNGNRYRRVECFLADGKWYAKEGYIKHGEHICPYNEDEIKKV